VAYARGYIAVQDPATAERGVMPEAALTVTHANRILPLAEMVPSVAALCRCGRR